MISATLLAMTTILTPQPTIVPETPPAYVEKLKEKAETGLPVTFCSDNAVRSPSRRWYKEEKRKELKEAKEKIKELEEEKAEREKEEQEKEKAEKK